jgi:hypothetical protein
LIAVKMTLAVHCHNSRCHHSRQLDFGLSAIGSGRTAPAMSDDLLPRLRCVKGKEKAGADILASKPLPSLQRTQ